MKALRPLLFLAGALCGTLAFAAEKTSTPSPVEVTFQNPAEFSDFTDSSTSRDSGQEHLMDQMRAHLQDRAAARLAPGQKLQIKFTNIDLAGDFEPWRGPQMNDIRIVKDLYPPRATIEFKLINADGSIAAQGERKLQNLGFLMSSPFPRDDSLRWDKDMLNDWLAQEFPRKK